MPWPPSTQDELDYYVSAQARVAYATRALTKGVQIALTSTGALLPDDVARVLAVSDGSRDIPLIVERDALMALAGATLAVDTGHWIIGRTIGVYPGAMVPLYTVTYQARPTQPTTEAGSLELTGEHARLTDRLVAHYQLADDGQPERSAGELAFYQQDALRLRARRTYPRRRRIAIKGWPA